MLKHSLEKFDSYVHNAPVICLTDCKPLSYLLKSPMNNKKIQTWALSISGYDVTIEHLPGRENTCADMLSRVRHENVDLDQIVESDASQGDMNDHAFQVNLVDTSHIAPLKFVSNKKEEE